MIRVCPGILFLAFSYVLAGDVFPQDREPQTIESGDYLIDRLTATEHREAIPLELYTVIKQGGGAIGASNKAIPFSFENGWSEESAERFTITANGGIEQPFSGSGLPFGSAKSVIGSGSAKDAGRKLLWNSGIAVSRGAARSIKFALKWYKFGKLEQDLIADYSQSLDTTESQGNIKSIFRERLTFDSPSTYKGYTWLSFRLIDDTEDYFWLFSPVLKRSRQLTGTNRGDPIVRIPLSFDDLVVAGEKPSKLLPVEIGEVQKLMPIGEPVISRGEKDKQSCTAWNQPLPTAAKSQASANANNTTGFLELFVGTKFFSRNLIKVVAISSDPFAAYGRKIIYFDAETNLPVYKFDYDRSGVLSKIVVGVYRLIEVDTGERYPFLSRIVVADERTRDWAVASAMGVKICDVVPGNLGNEHFDPYGIASITPSEPQPVR